MRTLAAPPHGDRSPVEAVRSQLERAYAALARAWLYHYAQAAGRNGAAVATASWRELAAEVRRVDGPVDLRPYRNDLIDKEEEVPGEVLDTLGHMEVLIAAAVWLESRGTPPWLCAPSTSSAIDGPADFLYYYEVVPSGAEVVDRIPDLQGEQFVLEAYGGVDYANNGKLAADLDSLRFLSQKYSNVRCFLAARREAVRGNWSAGFRLRAKCPKRRGGPWEVAADVLGRWDDIAGGPYTVLELGSFTSTHATRTPEVEDRLDERDWCRRSAERFFRDDGEGDDAYDQPDQLRAR